jgi:sulfhydrogenase subunit beta (sulfur reductase)
MRIIDRAAFEALLDVLRSRGFEVILPQGSRRELLGGRIDRAGDPVAMLTTQPPRQTRAPKPRAFVGLRSCELLAVRAMDGILLSGSALDPEYAQARRRAVLIGVDCQLPDETCYCGAVGAGPRCTEGFDLALTELPYGYLVVTGSETGEGLLEAVPSRPATPDEEAAADRMAAEARRHLRWRLDLLSASPTLVRERDVSEWAQVGDD